MNSELDTKKRATGRASCRHTSAWVTYYWRKRRKSSGKFTWSVTTHHPPDMPCAYEHIDNYDPPMTRIVSSLPPPLCRVLPVKRLAACTEKGCTRQTHQAGLQTLWGDVCTTHHRCGTSPSKSLFFDRYSKAFFKAAAIINGVHVAMICSCVGEF